MLTNQQLKILLNSHSFDQWKKNSGMEPFEAMRWWNRYRWNVTREDKEFLEDYEKDLKAKAQGGVH